MVWTVKEDLDFDVRKLAGDLAHVYGNLHIPIETGTRAFLYAGLLSLKLQNVDQTTIFAEINSILQYIQKQLQESNENLEVKILDILRS